jgi:NitT/TauT family transport system ATP-binding protein|tara:strand:+ start:143 stop:1789 length:1647 start_codon:yes stop_codon:yes gene_type:complete
MPNEIRIGISEISFSLPLVIAKEQKLFQKEKLNVKFFTNYKEAQSMCKDVVSKKLDVAGMVALPIILEQETKNPGSLQFSNIAVEDKSHPFVFLITNKDSTIKSIAQLQGKKIGIFPTTAFQLWMEIILKKHKVNPASTNIIQLNPKDHLNALVSGKVDVIFTNDPTATKILESGEAKKVTNESVLDKHIFEEYHGFPIGGLVLQRDFIRQHPEQAAKVVKVIDSAIRFLKSHPQKAKTLCKKHYSQDFQKYIEKISELSYWKDSEIQKEQLQELTDIYYYNELFKRPLNSSLLLFQPNYRIKFVDVKKSRKRVQVLKNFNLELRKAEFVTIFGPNGCGKTTILNILAGLLNPDGGDVSINNEKVEKSKVGYVYQDYRKTLMPWKKIIDNIGFSLTNRKLSKATISKEVKDLCSLLDIKLPLDSYPNQLSGGQQQMTSILAALIEKPEVLLLDEPFSAIDFQTTISLQEKIMDIWQKLGITIIFISHDIDEAIFLANKVCLLSNKPTKVKNIFENKMPYPRTLEDKEQKEFIKLKAEIIDIFAKEVNL